MKKLAGFALVLAMFVSGAASVSAAELHGWGWSETFGWLSFNSADAGAGGGPYAVSVAGGTGNMTGYAWSENLGWVSFNVSDIPAVCSATPQARLNTSTGAVTGYAYALAYGTGADGCIELSGSNHASPDTLGTGGVTFDTATGLFKGYAWAGDTSNNSGPGWIQFNPSVDNYVSCTHSDCGYGGSSVNGSCTASIPYINAPVGTNVTFTAVPTGGTGPYVYSWNSGSYSSTATNPGSSPYMASGPGPIVKVRDNLGIESANIFCPNVTIASAGSSSLKIGRTVVEANSGTLSSLIVRQTRPFALVWELTLDDSYDCSGTISPNPGNASWTSNWINNSNWANPAEVGGNKTWSGNTGTSLTAGTVVTPVNPGIYRFSISCTDGTDTQSANVSLKVNSASEVEI